MEVGCTGVFCCSFSFYFRCILTYLSTPDPEMTQINKNLRFSVIKNVNGYPLTNAVPVMFLVNTRDCWIDFFILLKLCLGIVIHNFKWVKNTGMYTI